MTTKKKKKGKVLPKAVKAWVAVPTREPNRLNAGYWIMLTRAGIQDIVMRESAIPSQWSFRQVRIVPLRKGAR